MKSLYTFVAYERGLETRVVGTSELGEEPGFDTTNCTGSIVTVRRAEDVAAWVAARNSVLTARWIPNQDCESRQVNAERETAALATLAELEVRGER